MMEPGQEVEVAEMERQVRDRMGRAVGNALIAKAKKDPRLPHVSTWNDAVLWVWKATVVGWHESRF